MFEKIKSDIKIFESHHGEGFFQKIYYPMFSAVLLIRLQGYLYNFRLTRPMSYLIVRLNDFLFGIWIGPKVKIGTGFFLGHARGLIVNPNTIIGDNCVILQRVTLGGPNIVLGKNVFIGAGAQIISKKGSDSLSIGDNVRIGAGAIVVSSIPDNATVVGPSAKTIE